MAIDMQEHIKLSEQAALYDEAHLIEQEATQLAERVANFTSRAKESIAWGHETESFIGEAHYATIAMANVAGSFARVRIKGDVAAQENERKRLALLADSDTETDSGE